MGSGTARGGRLTCNQDNRWVGLPQGPPKWAYLMGRKSCPAGKSRRIETA